MPTDEQWQKIVRVVNALVKKAKEHDQSIEDLWEKLNNDFDTEVSLVDEAVEKVERNNRRINRLEARVKELEDDD